MKVHPHDPLLYVWVSDPGGLKEEIAQHIAGCPRCLERAEAGELLHRLEDLAPTRRGAGPSTDYGPVLERTLTRALQHKERLLREREEAPRLAKRLLSLPAPRRALLLENSRRFKTWGLCEWLLEESLGDDAAPAAHEDLARLALEVAEHFDAGLYGAERVEDLQARAWGSLGRILHLAGNLSGAESAFAAAYRHLLRGTHDGLERAIHLEWKAPLLAASGRLPSALALLKRAAKLFVEAGEVHRAGRCLVAQIVLRATGGAGRSRRLGRRQRRLATS